ncbi:hypothetical protein NVV30_14650, partial [Pseudomonas syringae]|uniref:hypothetical protein n=1 Tax=Pseudomonas syringae TaxID=317 RepID=UPI00215AD685
GTALGAVATGAVAYGTATGDQTAYKIGEYTGYASIPFGLVGGFASNAVKRALKAAELALAQAAPAAVSQGLARSASILSTSGTVPVRRSSFLQAYQSQNSLPTRTLQIPRVGPATRPQTNSVSGFSNPPKPWLRVRMENAAGMRNFNTPSGSRTHVRT